MITLWMKVQLKKDLTPRRKCDLDGIIHWISDELWFKRCNCNADLVNASIADLMCVKKEVIETYFNNYLDLYDVDFYNKVIHLLEWWNRTGRGRDGNELELPKRDHDSWEQLWKGEL